jgi:hypothetical protein
MAVITADSFNPLQRYVSVRLQQGVPLVDAEWNEQDDVRRFELRAYLKWFVGDGVPFGSDAFLLEAAAPPVASDFTIRSGVSPAPGGTSPLLTGLRHVGRCLVDGLDATIGADIAYRGQKIHIAQPGAAAAAALRGTVTIPELPVLTGSLTVYLDVWERLVRPDEEPSLLYTEIGTETCVRLRREWAVRARDDTGVPVPGDADFEAGHSYYALGTVARVASDPVVYPSQVVDRREQRLLTPPSTLIDDVLGTSPERYRRGLDRPAISLRSAVNALLRGELPSSPEQVIAPDPSVDAATRSVLTVGPETVIFWHGNRAGGIDQVFGTTWLTSQQALAGTNAPVQVSAATTSATLPSAVLLPTSPQPSVLVVYATDSTPPVPAGTNIRYKRAPAVSGLVAAAEEDVSVQPENEGSPVAVRTGDIVTFFWFWNDPGPNDRIRYRRRQYQTATWAEATANWLDSRPQHAGPGEPRYGDWRAARGGGFLEPGLGRVPDRRAGHRRRPSDAEHGGHRELDEQAAVGRRSGRAALCAGRRAAAGVGVLDRPQRDPERVVRPDRRHVVSGCGHPRHRRQRPPVHGRARRRRWYLAAVDPPSGQR